MKNEYMDFMAFREELMKGKIRECLDAARRGEKSIDIDADNLSDDEIEYIQEEVKRIIISGKL